MVKRKILRSTEYTSPGSNPQRVTVHYLSPDPNGRRVIVTKPLNHAITALVRLVDGSDSRELAREVVIAKSTVIYESVGAMLQRGD